MKRRYFRLMKFQQAYLLCFARFAYYRQTWNRTSPAHTILFRAPMWWWTSFESRSEWRFPSDFANLSGNCLEIYYTLSTRRERKKQPDNDDNDRKKSSSLVVCFLWQVWVGELGVVLAFLCCNFGVWGANVSHVGHIFRPIAHSTALIYPYYPAYYF